MIALVTGASRGLGRGIAYSLGEAGATVYVTGRTAAELEKTAAEVTQRGGTGIAVVCDHTDDAQVEGLFARIPALDVLVNNVWGGYENHPNGCRSAISGNSRSITGTRCSPAGCARTLPRRGWLCR